MGEVQHSAAPLRGRAKTRRGGGRVCVMAVAARASEPRHGHCGSSALSQFKLLYKFSLISWTSVPFRRKKKEARRKWVGHFSTCQPVYRAIHPLCRNVLLWFSLKVARVAWAVGSYSSGLSSWRNSPNPHL